MVTIEKERSHLLFYIKTLLLLITGGFYPLGATFHYHPFSVDSNFTVYFSPGVLQFNASSGTHKCADGKTKSGTWQFAHNQWDYIGDERFGTVYVGGIKCNNGLISKDYPGWIDLFGWGTSGYDNRLQDPLATHFNPWASLDSLPNNLDQPNNKFGFGPSINMLDTNLTGTSRFYDWGAYNTILFGEEVYAPGSWRLLSYKEWTHLIDRKDSLGNFLYGYGGILLDNGDTVLGLILLPDDWKLPNNMVFSCYDEKGNSKLNCYNINEWIKMEDNGAVFSHFARRTLKKIAIAKNIKENIAISHLSTTLNYAKSHIATDHKSLGIGEERCSGVPIRLVRNANKIPCVTTHIFDTICDNEKNQMANSIYYDTLLNSDNCDSVVVLHLTVRPPYYNTTYDTIYQGQKYEWNGYSFDQAGTYVYNSPSVSKCDSILILQLYVKPTFFIVSGISAISNSTLIENGTNIHFEGSNMKILVPQNAHLRMYNIVGLLIDRSELHKGENLYQLPTAPGSYFLYIESNFLRLLATPIIVK